MSGRAIAYKLTTKQAVSTTKYYVKGWPHCFPAPLLPQGIPWGSDLLKSELYALCKPFEPKPDYKIDKIAKAAGHSILRTPQYHPELQPIESCWGIVKDYMAKHCDFTLETFRNNLPSAFNQVTLKTCHKLIAKTITEEDKYWEEDRKIDENQEVDVN